MKNLMIIALLVTSITQVQAFCQNNDELVKVHVTHLENGQVMEIDTILNINSSYTVNQFLEDQGINAEKAMIVDLRDIKGEHHFVPSEDIWMFDQNRSQMIFIDLDNEETIENEVISKSEIKRLISTTEDGKTIERIWLNGEEVDELPQDIPKASFLMENVNGEPAEIQIRKIRSLESDDKSGEDDVEMNIEISEIIDENGEAVQVIYVNGEQVEAIPELPAGNRTELFIIEAEEGGKIISTDQNMHSMEVEVIKTIDEFGLEHIEYRVNGEVVDELPELDWENEEGVVIEQIISENGGGMQFVGVPDMEGFTVVTILPAQSEEPQVVDLNLQVQNLSFYPNPNEGRFNIEFFMPSSGRTKLKLLDLNGRLVWEDNLGKFSGQYRKDIDISKEGAGTYILQILQNGKALAEKIIVR